MSEKLKLGIIGMGMIGTIHAEAHQAVGETELVAACDVAPKKLAKAADRFDVKGRFSDYRDLLKADVDAVAVCLGNAMHREVSLAAIEAGKHVFLEKPMAVNATEAAEITAGAEKADTILQVGMCWRLHPASKVIREWIKSGLFGQIHHMHFACVHRRGIPGLGRWFTTKAESGGGAMIDTGVHFLDLSMYLSGHWAPTAVSAMTYAKFGPKMRDYKYANMWAGPPEYNGVFDVEDYAAGFVRFGQEATLSFESGWASNSPGESFVEILGDKGGVRAFDGKPLRILGEHAGRLADIEPKLDENGSVYEAQAAWFVSACRGERPPRTTARQGLTVMKLIDAAYASSQAGAEIPVTK